MCHAGSKRIEADYTATRMRMVQLEAGIKSRDKELDKLAKATEALKTELHEVGGLHAEGRREGCHCLCERSSALVFAGRLTVCAGTGCGLRSRGCACLPRQASSKLAKSEDACRKVEAELAIARGKGLNLEGHMRWVMLLVLQRAKCTLTTTCSPHCTERGMRRAKCNLWPAK